MLNRFRAFVMEDDRGSATADYALIASVVFLAMYLGFSSVNSAAATRLVGTQSGLTCSAIYASPGTQATLDANGNLSCTPSSSGQN